MRFWRKVEKEPKAPKYLEFQQCEACGFSLATGEGTRGCHNYGCPTLPEELDVTCPTCLYNFYADDGNPGCTDPPSCEFARKVAPERVANIRRWIAAR